MSPSLLDAASAKNLLDRGAMLVDVREADEYAREHVPEALHHPLSALSTIDTGNAKAVIFHCRSGARTKANAPRLACAVRCEAYLLDGGLDAWKRAGNATIKYSHQPIEIMRQVQIAAGTLVLLGVVLGAWIAPAFLGLSAFVGAGLVFAGSSGWCGMAKLLALMPWNQFKTKPITS